MAKGRGDIERSEHYIGFKRNVALRRITTTIRFPERDQDSGDSSGGPPRFLEIDHKWEYYSDGEEDLQSARWRRGPDQHAGDSDSNDNDGRRIPLICFGGISGRADQFFDLLLSLCPRGFWIMSVDLPRVDGYGEFVLAFEAFLQQLKIDRCHLLCVAVMTICGVLLLVVDSRQEEDILPTDHVY